jgi:hypothetical protein
MKNQPFPAFCRATVCKGRAMITTVVLLQLTFSGNAAEASSFESNHEYRMKEEFRQPSNEFRPWVWYHMMGGFCDRLDH